MKRVQVVSVVMLFFFFSSAVVAGQEIASLTGVVSDKTGAVVTDATVKLVDTKTNTSYQAKTNSVGTYNFVKVLPGPGYKLSVSKDGFETLTVSNIYLGVGATHTQNVQLQVGAVEQTVEVSGAGQSVSLNTTDATIGNNFDMRAVHELPIQVRDSPAALLGLQPGVISHVGANDDPNFSVDGAVTGARTDQSNITLDGIDVNDFATGQAFTPVANAPVDSIQEFRGETANPLAANGRGSGGQIELVTKSGTNAWHGSVSEYHRNTETEANSFFNKQVGLPRTKLIRNQFGAELGGPVVKNKLFFYFDYNGRRDARESNVLRIVPLDHVHSGQIAYLDDNGDLAFATQTDLAAIDPLGLGANASLLSFLDDRYPRANDLSVGDGLNTGGFRFNSPVHLTENNYVSRIDYNASNNHKLFGRFTILRESSGDNVNFLAPVQFPADPITHTIVDHSYAYVVGHTWTISPNMVNQFVFGETRSQLDFPTLFNPAGVNNFSVFANDGSGSGILSAPFSSQASQTRIVPIPVFRDDFSYLRGNHHFQFGGTFKPIKTRSQLVGDLNSVQFGLGGGLTNLDAGLRPGNILADPAAQAEWDTVFTFLLGRYGQINSAFNNDRNLQPLPQGTGNNRHYRYYETEVYLQDTWQARKDLTLTYGLRYQYYSVPYEADGFEAIPNVDFNPFFSVRAHNGPRSISGPFSVPVISYNFGGKANDATGLYHPDWRDFAPRFSFAYNPSFSSGALERIFGDRKMVVRGGAGVVFDHPVTNALNFVQDQNTYIFQNTTTTVFGEDPDPATNLANDPRFTGINALPPIVQPDPVTVPFSPFVDSNGVPFGAQAVTFNYAIDPGLKTPYSITFSFGVQRELPGNFVLEANYFGRLGRRLLAQSDAGQVVDFRDPASGQFLAAAFAQTARELRAGVAVTPQPFWENQIQEAIGTDCTTAFGAPSCTELIAGALGGLIVRGDLADTVQALDFFQVLVPGVGLSPQFDTNVYVTNQSFSSYNGLLATLHKKASHGLQFDLNYTYAHSIDNVSVVANAPFADFVCDVSRLRLCRGTSDFDATHVISVNAIYELPLGRGKQFGGNARGWLNQVIGGWQVSGINTWRTGLPWRTSTEAFPIGFANDVPAIFNGDQAAVGKDIHFDPASGAIQYFASPTRALGAFRGPLGLEAGQRNLLRGPSFFLLDLALSKKFPITERVGLEFRAEAYNTFNHTNFSLPSGNDIFQPSQFGQITTTASSPREMQFALRLKF